ncbi:hypothetical protein [Glutamicibacter sp.]|nr:hypothetical protein [Glutamicibacter sp.]HJX77942.1 hypothetical protein [Glutamicibacter sp.]
MTGEQVDKLTAAELLATADRASHTMVAAQGPTRIFLLVYALIASTVLSLADVISGTALLWLAALIIPFVLVQFFSTRNRVRARPVLDGSATYGWYFLMAIIAVSCLRMWTAVDPASIGAKWIISCFILWQLLSAAQRALDKDRVQDTREQAV